MNILHHQRSLFGSNTANIQTSLPYLTGGFFQHPREGQDFLHVLLLIPLKAENVSHPVKAWNPTMLKSTFLGIYSNTMYIIQFDFSWDVPATIYTAMCTSLQCIPSVNDANTLLYDILAYMNYFAAVYTLRKWCQYIAIWYISLYEILRSSVYPQ